MSIQAALRKSPVIAAVRHETDVAAAVRSPVTVAFVLFGTINGLIPVVEQLRAAGKKTFVHVDLIGGLASDAAAVEYLARQVHPDGVISTRGQIVRAALEQELLGIQRLFVLDSAALETAGKQIKGNHPSAVEVMPGTLPQWVLETLQKQLQIPIVVGGLLRTRTDVNEALARGAAGVSVSNPALWSGSGS